MERTALLVFLVCVNMGYGSKILLVFPMPTNSHANLGDGFVRNLVKAGHDVTYITAFPAKTAIPKVRRIIVDNTYLALPEKLLSIEVLMNKEVKMDNHHVTEIMFKLSNLTFEHEDVKRLINDPREQFDIVIAEWILNDVYSGLSAVFNCPYIWFVPFEPTFITLSLIDEATNPAYTTDVSFSYMPPFTFLERINVLWYQFVTTAAITFYYRNNEKALFEKSFQRAVAKRGRILSPYDDIRLNASLILGNTHVSYGTNTRLPQNFKPIGGYHIDSDVKPLPADLQNILDSSKHGVIYFSMGSNLKSKDFPDEIKKSLLKMFGTLNQTVLWKFEEPFSNLPKNVHILKWAPQLSILAHSKCILFITHGGILSTIEAVHFGVPIIGIPVFFDQFGNIDRATFLGFGRKVMLTSNVAEDLKDVIKEMTSNPRYKQKMKEISFIYHNRTVDPGYELVHWVEHVIATRGAVYLRSPALHVPFYQKMYLDLIAIVGLIIFIVKKCISLQIIKYNDIGKAKKKIS